MTASVTDTERWKERGVMLRVFVYVFATHAFAGSVRILFSVGQHARKWAEGRTARPPGREHGHEEGSRGLP